LLPLRVDLHCHLLPEIDDGPKTLQEALLLARALTEMGFSQAVATPHYIEGYSLEYRRRVAEAHTRLVQAVEAEKIPLKVFLGGELLLQPGLVDLAQKGELPTLNGTRYLLLELPLYQPLPLYAGEVFFMLQARGYIPILAHPERMETFQVGDGKICHLVRSGVLLQVNLGSLIGAFGPSVKKLARDLLKNDLVTFLATDSHAAALPALLADGLAKLSLPPALLGENPHRALQDGEIPLPCLQQTPPWTARIRKILGL
jgi:protein-tyrosine phosphatase